MFVFSLGANGNSGFLFDAVEGAWVSFLGIIEIHRRFSLDIVGEFGDSLLAHGASHKGKQTRN